MRGKRNKGLKKLVCAGMVAIALLAGAREGRAAIVEVTEVKIIRGELVGGRFQAIEEVDELIVGDVFVITTEVTNLGSETEYVLNIYDWDLSPENRVEVIGTSGLCFTYFTLQPGESAVLYPFCLSQAFKAKEAGGVTMNIYVKDWASGNLCQYTFEFTVIPKPAMIYYVDADANGLNDGSSWADAYNYLQDALADANWGDEVRVAEGIYKPDQGVGITPGDRTATFQLKNGVAIKGSYAGFGEPDSNARDIDLYETILSGDLYGDDIDVNDPADLLDEPTRGENSNHVLTGSGTDETAVLEGLTITSGNDNRYERSPHYPFDWQAAGHGGGIYNDSGRPTLTNCTFIRNSAGTGGGIANVDESSPTVANCTFSQNSAQHGGGGMYNEYDSSTTLNSCTFIGNSAGAGGGIYNSGNPTLNNCIFSNNRASNDGGGMFNSSFSSPNINNCTFIGNSAGDEAGGMYIYSTSNQTLINCIFIENSAKYHGGAMVVQHCSPTLINCTFTGNKTKWHKYGGGGIFCDNEANPTLINCQFSGNIAGEYGGGMCNTVWSSPTLWNCTFTGNSAGNIGGGIWNRGNSNPTLTNCIIWGNEAPEGPQIAVAEVWNGSDPSMVTVSYSDVQGGEQDVYVGPGCVLIWDRGNIDVDPCFADPNNGDYHLLEDSPCIDAGDPNYIAEPNETDLDGRPRVIGGRVDMGAYESPVPAEVRIVPRSINLASMGKWITCYIRLPEDYNVTDIDPNSVFLDDEIQAESLWVDEEEQVARVRFKRSEVQGILGPGEVELTVSGELTDGTVFEGRDIIRVIDKGRRKSVNRKKVR